MRARKTGGEMRSDFVRVFFVGAVLLLGGGAAFADPVVPGMTVKTFAVLPGSAEISFDTSGTMFVGHDEVGGGVAYSIYRVSPAGAVSLIGNPLLDPDMTVVDKAGTISGIPGAVLVGGPGYVATVQANGTTTTLFTSSTFGNLNDGIFDKNGRLLFYDDSPPAIYQSTGGMPSLLFNPSGRAGDIAISPSNDIYLAFNDGSIAAYDPNGVLKNSHFGATTSQTTLAFGPGGPLWGTDLYAISAGNLVRFDASGNGTIVGTGFDSGIYVDMAFGPDNGLYISIGDQGKIIEVIPEPASLSLLILGGLTVLRRRKK